MKACKALVLAILAATSWATVASADHVVGVDSWDDLTVALEPLEPGDALIVPLEPGDSLIVASDDEGMALAFSSEQPALFITEGEELEAP